MKNNNVKIVSPVGVSQYAWLTQPDTRFDSDGHYKTNLIIKAEDAKPLIKSIDDEMKQSLTLAKEKAKGKNIKTGALFYQNIAQEFVGSC